MTSSGANPVIGLIANNGCVSFASLVSIAQALQYQVTNHLQPIWGLGASVVAFPNAQSFTPGAWPIIFVNGLAPGQEGYHLLSNGIPSAYVDASNYSSLFASHECLEMIVDPSGNSRVNGPGLGATAAQTVQYLLEICDPCIDYSNAYQIAGCWVADFVTPDYYTPRPGSTRFSFSGKLNAPAQLTPYGYLTWYSASQNQWYQRTADAAGVVADAAIGIPNIQSLPARMAVDRMSRPHQLAVVGKAVRKSMRQGVRAYRSDARQYGEHLTAFISDHLAQGKI